MRGPRAQELCPLRPLLRNRRAVRDAMQNLRRYDAYASAEGQPLEFSGTPPAIDIFEVGRRAGGIADGISRSGSGILALIVVVARRAIRRADHAAGARQQEFDPAVLGLARDLDLLAPALARFLHDRGDGLAGFGQVVRHVGDEVGALRRLHEKQVGEAVNVNAVLAAHPFGPGLRKFQAIAAGDIETGALGEIGPDFEARGIDDAVDLVFDAADDHAIFADALDTLAVGVDKLRRGLVEGLEIFVVKARPLAELAVPRLQVLRSPVVLDDRLD